MLRDRARRMARMILVFLVLSKFALCSGRVSGWGESCNFTQECNDHRFVCQGDEEGDEKKCVCDRFHEWQGNYTGCVPKYNTTTILGMVLVITNREVAMEKTRNSAFTIQMVAGSFVFITVLLASFSVCVYCWHVRKKDRALRTEVQNMVNKKRRAPSTSAVV